MPQRLVVRLGYAGCRCAGLRWFGVASRPWDRNSAAAGESMARPWSADDGNARGRHLFPGGVVEGGRVFFSNAPGETLDPVLPDPAAAALCVMLPLEGTALEHVLAGGPVALVLVVPLLALLLVSSPRGNNSRASTEGLESLL